MFHGESRAAETHTEPSFFFRIHGEGGQIKSRLIYFTLYFGFLKLRIPSNAAEHLNWSEPSIDIQ